jgi:membrane-associated phospholipid phosphatase
MKTANGKTAALLAEGMIVFIILCFFFIDIPVALFCNHLDTKVRDIFELITPLGISTWYLVGSFSLFLWFTYGYRRRTYAHRALFLFTSVAVSGIMAVILKGFMGRFRPKMLLEEGLYGFNFFATIYEKNSFPSGHATTAFSIACALSLFFPRFRIPLFCFALVVAASRVVITSHYLSDMVGGALIAFLTVFFLQKGMDALERRGVCKFSL